MSTKFKQHSLSVQETNKGCKAGLDMWMDICLHLDQAYKLTVLLHNHCQEEN